MKRFSRLLVFLALFVLTSESVQAWNYAGHRVIASIAWDQLTPETQRDMVTLLKQHPRFEQDFQSRMPGVITKAAPAVQDRWLFMRAATWPDIVRSFKDEDREKYHRGTWHYINQPIYLDAAAERALSSKLSVNTAQSIRRGDDPLLFNILQALEYNVALMKDPVVSPAEKAIALCWIMHLTGDSHQPLHSSALFSKGSFPEGDRGGNSIRIGKSNLHAQWDGLLGNSFKDSEIVSQAVGLARDPALKQLGEQATKNLNYAVWIDESHALAKSAGYTPMILESVKQNDGPQNEFIKLTALPAEYYRTAGAIAVKRAAQSGWRLAAVINSLQ
ncbi:S1/P1 nuclease [Gimesia sp.]|uniref:S1/P1 nuclease n=1 Tax=Gimesia sp. TaxID=2024833 RepID=UPI003A8FA038